MFSSRATVSAHPQMRQVMIPLLIALQKKVPALFNDIDYDHNFSTEHYAEIEFVEDL